MFGKRRSFPWAVSLLLVGACGDEEILTVETTRIIEAREQARDPATADDGGGTSNHGSSGGEPGGSGGDEPDAGTSSGGGPSAVVPCPSARGEALPGRRAVTSSEADDGGPETLTITANELYAQFTTHCGASSCHGGGDAPLSMSPAIYKLSRHSFDQRPNLGEQSIARILSSDPSKVMPPGSGDGSKRRANDPIRLLGEYLLIWQNQGFPAQIEVVLEDQDEGLPEDPYLLSESRARELTNLGSCVPQRAIAQHTDEMRALDALFEGMATFDDLPPTLFETDLVSLDSEALAKRGVYSYAPTYALFSDNASKMRYVRVPVGKTIAYREDTQDFEIPPNTRFYKTFLKRVVEADGTVGYRKMETRLIVARPDEVLADGTFRPRALRATYAWDKDEKMARLVSDPLRNGEPWADRLCPYVTEEGAERDPQKNPISAKISGTCTYMTREEREDPWSGRIAHYAIPGSSRCDECHLGSSSHSYILGFNPFQVDRRPGSEGGVYDHPASEDELSQLERMITYGVISGIEPGQAKLEESQLPREPRNDYELTAQGYMLGNCAFCHNPHGFPTIQNRLLEPFDLFPRLGPEGGAFQFPLELYSPRATFDDAQTVRFPYITAAFGNSPQVGDHKVGPYLPAAGAPGHAVVDWDQDPPDYDEDKNLTLLGPWRSLLWRNVYTPFTYPGTGQKVGYSDASAIFLHMPRNVAGYDCRAHEIMASWMLSIPSVLKPDANKAPDSVLTKAVEQPSREVLPEEPGFEDARVEAEQRVADYLRGITGSHCPNTDDILDPGVLSSPVSRTTDGGEVLQYPAPTDQGAPFRSERLTPGIPLPQGMFFDHVPEHAHWVTVDVTDAAGQWTPRRTNWKSVVVTREVPAKLRDIDDMKVQRAIDDILEVHMDEELEAFSLEPQPLGLWHPECSELAQDSPTVEELKARGQGDMTAWLFDPDEPPASHGKVHFQSRGEAVFTAICRNCHGAAADSRSPLAITMLELTGGQTRVANFVDGLFGPRLAPGLFAENEFTIDQGATPAEWQLRYLLFMTLGGTEATIPGAVLNLVSKSPFYGQAVTNGSGLAASGNMLESASETCKRLPTEVFWGAREGGLSLQAVGTRTSTGSYSPQLPFAKGSGHLDLWSSLCNFRNEPLIYVLQLNEQNNARLAKTRFIAHSAYRSRDDAGEPTYPVDHPVGNRFGEIARGVQPDNTLPWCVRIVATLEAAAEEEEREIREHLAEEGVPSELMPLCPPELFEKVYDQEIHRIPTNPSPSGFNADFLERWAQKGAINTGITAFYYLDRWTKGLITPAPTYDACRR